MNPKLKEDLLAMLTELLNILKDKEESDAGDVKELSNHIIHDASVFQDEDSISIAILIYSLAKVMERMHGNIDYALFSQKISMAKNALRADNSEMYRKIIKDLFTLIRNLDNRLKMFINEVVEHAQLKKGCKICMHGISLGRTAHILGVNQWDLMGYLGQTKITEAGESKIGVKDRVRLARGLFR